MAILTSGCSKNKMLQAQHARMVKARKCNKMEKMTIVKNATSSMNQMMRSGYEMANATFACYKHWMGNESKDVCTDTVMGLYKCLNDTKLPKSPVAKKFQMMLSTMAKGITKLKYGRCKIST